MNIAYMILAHHQPLQLQRLLSRLAQPHVYFYIHIDKKVKDLSPFHTALSGIANVAIINTRDVNWMGFTMIEAELDLMEIAYRSGIPFKYYVLMSGQDYPIKSNEYLNNFFAAHTSDFMMYTNLNFISQDMRNKITQYHFHDIPFINPRNPKRIPFLVYLYFGAHKRLTRLVPKRKFYNNFEPFFGSQWFALMHDTIGYILDFVKNNPGYISSARNTDGPDEYFFQTIIMNSDRRTNLCGYDKYLEWLKNRTDADNVFIAPYNHLRYMDWSERPGKSKPAVLDDEYYDIICDTHDLYARKVDEVASASLLDKIDKHILHK